MFWMDMKGASRQSSTSGDRARAHMWNRIKSTLTLDEWLET
jgi:hypothetical protein